MLLLAAGAAAAEPFPKVASYAALRSSGYPLVKVVDGPVDPLTARRLARHPLVTLDVCPVWPSRPDIALALRQFNPTMKILGYVTPADFWLDPSFVPLPSDQSYPALVHRALTATNGWLYGRDGAVWVNGFRVNLGKRAVADTLAGLYATVVSSRIFDGLFMDQLSSSVGWTDGTGGRRIDVARAGFASLAAMDSARAVNCLRIVQRVRTASAVAQVVIGNGTSSSTMGLDGWMREGLGTLISGSAAVQWVRASMRDFDWLKSEGGWSGPYSSTYCRVARYTLGIASLGRARASMSSDRDLTTVPTYLEWWFDEYAVTPYPGGDADTTGRYVGWLGEPAAPAYLTSEGAWRRNFQNGVVLVNTSSSALTVDLHGYSWRRINGFRDRTTNNGRTERFQVIPSQDAVFLLSIPLSDAPDPSKDGGANAPRSGAALGLSLSIRANPFTSGELVVTYSIPECTPASLEVFDLAGRLVHGVKFAGESPGQHTLQLGAADRLVPGIYMVRLTQAGLQATARAVCLN